MRRVSRSLVISSAALLALLAAHDLSHALDDGLETGVGELALVAVPQWLALGVVMTVVVRGERIHAATAALLLGLAAAIGVAVVHLLPFAPAAYWDLDPSAVSWLLAWLPAALGVAVAALAWSQRRSASRAAATP